MTVRRRYAALVLTVGAIALPASAQGRQANSRREAAADTAQLETQAREIFARLLPVLPVPGPTPKLEVSADERIDARADDSSNITITRGLLRLCAVGVPPRGVSMEDVTRTRIAFIVAHELAHITHSHPGLFGTGVQPTLEKEADDDAVGALLVARFDTQRLYLPRLLGRIARARRAQDAGIPERTRQVESSVSAGHRHGNEWRLAWLLSVTGRFDDAAEFYRSFATKYPSPSAMYALAHTNVLAAWRVHPCTDRDVLRWFLPLRYDPRAQRAPFTVRSGSDESCPAFRSKVRVALEELGKVPAYPPARVATGALRLMLGDPSLDPTSKDGGATRLGIPCPTPSEDSAETAILRADACQISLLAQLEMTPRSAEARQVAIDGLRALRDRWPEEASLPYNLARILSEAGRASEAASLWAEFLDQASPGPYRDEAAMQLLLIRPGSPTITPAASEAASAPPSQLAEIRDTACQSAAAGVEISMLASGFRQCGSWGDELVIRRRADILIRTVSASSRFWPGTTPPSTPPVLVSNDATGDVVRVWDEEAWVFTDGAPSRVVYFKRAR